ncbi:MAG: amidotransferase 1, exosortase A system-associated [Gammaproteobacteria bacterium]|nr:amidotransferase 1, exosortase A system-associated [Gammaproteobacteria bacterium]
MCGIVGVFDALYSREINKALLLKMNETQHHRGPDGSGVHIEPGLGMAHKRLSIIDVSSGQQPLFNEDGSVVVVYNGEIYNYRELSQELIQRGHTFKTHSDTEVIVHAWEEWGPRCVDRFRGMFAFAIWDRNKKTLFLARDRLGIKPLFYTLLPDGHFIFSSELKALLLVPSLKREIDPQAVEDYFCYGYIPDPKTILKNVKKLPPGYMLSICHGKKTEVAPQQYWDIPFNLNESITEKEANDELIERLREAVNIRLIAEVPLGAFLSGGVDSSAVVSLMAALSPSKPVNTCSISFGEPAFNESAYASQVAQQYKTNHQAEQVDADDFDLIDRLSGLYDEPYADNSAIPTYRVCQLARKRVTVALSGDGGDENFAGYSRYAHHLAEENLRNYLPRQFRKAFFGFLGKRYPDLPNAPRVFRAKATFEMMAHNTIEGYVERVSVVRNSLRNCLFSKQFKSELQGYNAVEVLKQHAMSSPTQHPLSLVQYLDMKTYLPGDILTKVDRASMAHGLEVRVPILDHQLVEWVSSLPPHLKLNNNIGKYVFKKSLENYLPNKILYRKKMGFAVPLASWFRGVLRERVSNTMTGSLRDFGIFEHKTLNKILNEHQSGKRDHSAALWSLLMFDSAMKNFQ